MNASDAESDDLPGTSACLAVENATLSQPSGDLFNLMERDSSSCADRNYTGMLQPNPLDDKRKMLRHAVSDLESVLGNARRKSIAAEPLLSPIGSKKDPLAPAWMQHEDGAASESVVTSIRGMSRTGELPLYRSRGLERERSASPAHQGTAM